MFQFNRQDTELLIIIFGITRIFIVLLTNLGETNEIKIVNFQIEKIFQKVEKNSF